MRETEPKRGGWLRLTRRLSAKLNILLLGAMVLIFGLLGYLNVRLHRQHLEQNTLLSAERISDVVKHGTTDYMLRNDREGLYRSIQTMAAEPGMEKIRIFDQEGRITYTTDATEQNHVVDKTAEACYACHSQSQPLARVNRPDRFRIYRNSLGTRVLGIITPIENQPACSNAACHAHPAEQQILGVLDTNLSLAKADVQLAESSRRMIGYTACALLLIAVLSWFVVWQVVGRPVKALQQGTEHLAAGDLGYQIEVRSKDEIGELASSFNGMSHELAKEHNENVLWTRTLEQRVEQKTRELKRAHEHALHTEKMASIGKMAAVLAHEINNPLSGILTYAKLLRKWVEHDDGGKSRRGEICESLDLIASESRRCGDLVKNLLTFSRTTPMNLQPTDLNQVIDRALRLVQHQFDLGGVQVQAATRSGSASGSLRRSADRAGSAGADDERRRRDAARREFVAHNALQQRGRHSTGRGSGRWRRDSGRDSASNFRAVPHDEGDRTRSRARSCHQPKHSGTPSWKHRSGIRGWPRHHVHR